MRHVGAQQHGIGKDAASRPHTALGERDAVQITTVGRSEHQVPAGVHCADRPDRAIRPAHLAVLADIPQPPRRIRLMLFPRPGGLEQPIGEFSMGGGLLLVADPALVEQLPPASGIRRRPAPMESNVAMISACPAGTGSEVLRCRAVLTSSPAEFPGITSSRSATLHSSSGHHEGRVHAALGEDAGDQRGGGGSWPWVPAMAIPA